MLTLPRFTKIRDVVLAASLLTTASAAQAALTLSATRIVHASDSHSSSVVVANPSERTFAAQAWVNTEQDDTVTAVPMIAGPALFRLEPGKEQTVQLNRLPNDLAQDRESLFYFNLQEIPQLEESGANILSIALRTRIKLFYRPSQLKTRPEDHLKQLVWSVEVTEGKSYLVVDNPSPFHFTFSRVEVKGPTHAESVPANDMLSPMSQQRYPMAKNRVGDKLEVSFTTINDYGAATAPVSLTITQ